MAETIRVKVPGFELSGADSMERRGGIEWIF